MIWRIERAPKVNPDNWSFVSGSFGSESEARAAMEKMPAWVNGYAFLYRVVQVPE